MVICPPDRLDEIADRMDQAVCAPDVPGTVRNKACPKVLASLTSRLCTLAYLAADGALSQTPMTDREPPVGRGSGFVGWLRDPFVGERGSHHPMADSCVLEFGAHTRPTRGSSSVDMLSRGVRYGA
jgi:hypothetical protein